jgi:hypothetical protein
MDYWYYSKYAVSSTGGDTADQQSFFNSSEVYDTSDSLVGDDEWGDCILYTAMLSSLTDEENSVVYSSIKAKKDEAFKALEEKWPDNKPLTTTNKYRFGSGMDGNGDASWPI